MAKITKVPNGPLVKKKGPYAGSTLKKGGVIKKAQDGFNKIKPGTKQKTPKYNIPESRFVITNDTTKVKPTRWINNPMPPSKSKNEFPMPSEALMDSISKKSIRNVDTSKLMKKKAQNGDTLSVKKPTWQKMTQAERAAIKTKLGPEKFKIYKDSVSADASNRANAMFEKNAATRGMTVEELRKSNARDAKRPNAPQEGLEIGKACKRGATKGSCSTGATYKGSSLKDTKRNGGPIKKAQNGKRVTRWMTDEEYKKETDSLSKNNRKIDPGFTISPKKSGKTTDPGFMKTPSNYDPNTKRKRVTSEDGMLQYLKNGNKIKKAKSGQMIKRADGSYSQRGLWDNIRANKGSGKKPTKQMLVQEKKIKAKSKK